MKPFAYLRPTSVADAAAALADNDGGARVIAGGQSLLLALKDRLERPSVLVSLQDVPEVRGVEYHEDGTLTVGAATTYWQLQSAALPEEHAWLSTVVGDVADMPVRRMGTVGGAVCQADPVFDFPVAAVVADAELELTSTRGDRRVAAAEFFEAPFRTARQPHELLTRVHFPAVDAAVRSSFVKHRLRRFDPAIVAVACLLRLDGGVVESARIACGAVGPVPVRLTDAEEVVTGRELTDDVARAAGDAAAASIELGDSNRMFRQSYKRDVLPVIVARALRAAVDGKE